MNHILKVTTLKDVLWQHRPTHHFLAVGREHVYHFVSLW